MIFLFVEFIDNLHAYDQFDQRGVVRSRPVDLFNGFMQQNICVGKDGDGLRMRHGIASSMISGFLLGRVVGDSVFFGPFVRLELLCMEDFVEVEHGLDEKEKSGSAPGSLRSLAPCYPRQINGLIASSLSCK